LCRCDFYLFTDIDHKVEFKAIPFHIAKMPPKNSKSKCSHKNLLLSSSRNASVAGYKRPTFAQLTAAATASGSLKKDISSKLTKEAEAKHASAFPAPLVLPEDDLAWDPKCPPQSVRSWVREKARNEVTNRRRTVYFVGPPAWDEECQIVEKLLDPLVKPEGKEKAIEHPDTEDVLDYLKAFYHGLPVKMLETPKLEFTADNEFCDMAYHKRRPRTTVPEKIYLNTNSTGSRQAIRVRPSPKSHLEYSHQLNLNDLLDAAIAILPDDAYALLMLVKHDIYEDDDDDFACGRAYGGSRIAVVSSARYNPRLDEIQKVDRLHSWPASHCEKGIEEWLRLFENMDVEDPDRLITASKPKGRERSSPMQAALAAHMSLPPLETRPSAAALYELWLGRVCRTGSHELGHCFGIAHCTYYACSMQSTASIVEDPRQPPYLCPVDLEKVLKATGADVKEKYRALLAFCEEHKMGQLFKAYGAWIKQRLEDLEDEEWPEVL
jgi:archaemetzincin